NDQPLVRAPGERIRRQRQSRSGRHPEEFATIQVLHGHSPMDPVRRYYVLRRPVVSVKARIGGMWRPPVLSMPNDNKTIGWGNCFRPSRALCPTEDDDESIRCGRAGVLRDHGAGAGERADALAVEAPDSPEGGPTPRVPFGH